MRFGRQLQFWQTTPLNFQFYTLPIFTRLHVTCKIDHHIRYLVLKYHIHFGLSISLTLVISESLVRSLTVM